MLGCVLGSTGRGVCCINLCQQPAGFCCAVVQALQAAAAQLDPLPHVIIASSDSDMQQLLDDSTYWLELQQVGDNIHSICLHYMLAAGLSWCLMLGCKLAALLGLMLAAACKQECVHLQPQAAWQSHPYTMHTTGCIPVALVHQCSVQQRPACACPPLISLYNHSLLNVLYATSTHTPSCVVPVR